MQGRRRLPAHRPARGVEVDRRRSRAGLRALDRAQRAGAARGAGPAGAPARLRRPRAYGRGPPLRRRSHARLRRRARAPARLGALADPQRGRGGDARHDRDALAGDQSARRRLGALAEHRHNPPHRGARAAAAGRHARDHHLDRERVEDALHVRSPRRSWPALMGRRVPA